MRRSKGHSLECPNINVWLFFSIERKTLLYHIFIVKFVSFCFLSDIKCLCSLGFVFAKIHNMFHYCIPSCPIEGFVTSIYVD